MISRTRAYLSGVAAALMPTAGVAALAIPAAAAAIPAAVAIPPAAAAMPALGIPPSGGAGLGGATGRVRSIVAAGAVQRGDVNVAADDGTITISTRASGFLGSRVRFTGSVIAGAPGESVEIERLGHETGWSWAPTAQSHLNRGGSFTVTWRANHIGRFRFRALVSGPRGQLQASSSSVTAIVYRWTAATWYGPTPNGNRTACGETLTDRTLGTANRTLPCGTPVSLYYQGKTIVVPVIDRGPYRSGVDYDLTAATARKLGTMSAGIATIGAVSLPRR